MSLSTCFNSIEPETKACAGIASFYFFCCAEVEQSMSMQALLSTLRCVECASRGIIARNVTGRPANRAGVRSTLKTVDRQKMTAEEEKIALVAVVAVKEE